MKFIVTLAILFVIIAFVNGQNDKSDENCDNKNPLIAVNRNNGTTTTENPGPKSDMEETTNTITTTTTTENPDKASEEKTETNLPPKSP